MRQKLLKYGLYLVFCVVCYFGILPFSLQFSGLQIAMILGILPAIILIGSGVWGFFYGFDLICPIMAALIYVFPIYLFMNDSALIYILVYGIVALAGVGVGSVVRTYAKK